MSSPTIYIYRPPESRSDYDYLVAWFAELQQLMRNDVRWDQSEVIMVDLNDQLGFDIVNEIRRLKTRPGPVIFASKVQQTALEKLAEKVHRDVCIYHAEGARNGQDIFDRCSEALESHLGGEPKITERELIAYLVVAKLARRDCWAGTAKNKAFLWSDDLPSGGFPKDISSRDILDVADALKNAGILKSKRSQGKTKYGLGDKATVERILSEKDFAGHHSMQKYFRRGNRTVSARDLTKNYES